MIQIYIRGLISVLFRSKINKKFSIFLSGQTRSRCRHCPSVWITHQLLLECISTECRKVKPNMYNSQSEHRILFKEPIRNESKYKRMPEARETLVTIGFSFESDWLRKWREYFGPVTERSEAKPKQSQIYLRHWIENCSWSNNTLVKGNLRANALNLFETISKRLRKDERMYPLLVMLLCISVLFL